VKVNTGVAGEAEVDVPSGVYTVKVRHSLYRPLTLRGVKLYEGGVFVLRVDPALLGCEG